jgi:N-acetylmuramic acid 6-phosphate etherase
MIADTIEKKIPAWYYPIIVLSHNSGRSEHAMSLTEDINPASGGIDAKGTREVLALMLDEEAKVTGAVRDQMPSIERAVEDAVASVRSGGRVFYAGAGTSGRLGVMDAAEVMPTFGRDCFRAVMAGGPRAVAASVEGAEDDEQAGRGEAGGLTSKDMAVGISASGSTPFVLGFLRGAGERGARRWLITCNKTVGDVPADGTIELLTGPEILAGSTRLKAATATKLALNMLSTAAMIRLGGVYDGLMVDVVASNKKLMDRAVGIITRITGCSEQEAAECLRLSGMRPKTAALMKARDLSKKEADILLEKTGGSLRDALKNG